MPRHVGRVELAAFVLVPALLPLIFGGQTQSAIVTAARATWPCSLTIYAVLGYGLVSILDWVLRRVLRQLMASFMLLARAVPLLMIFALLAFMSDEMWQVFSRISEPDLIAVGVLFVGPRDGVPRSLACRRRCAGSRPRRATRRLRCGTRQRRNVGLVLFTSQARSGAARSA